jgi:MFS family permease
VVLLTVLIDLMGFSIVFPLYPAMLRFYLGEPVRVGEVRSAEGEAGPLQRLAAALHPGGSPPALLTAVLFGGLLGSLYALLNVLSAPLLGRLSDRLGRRPVLILTTAGNLAGYLLWAFAGSFWLLLVSRVANGLMSGNLAVASAAVADLSGREGRTRGMALLGVAFGLGFLLGPVVGGAASLYDLSRHPALAGIGMHPFSVPALCAAALSLCNLVRLVWRFPETLPSTTGRPEQRAADGQPHALRLAWHTNFLFTLGLSGTEFTLTFLAAERLHYGPAQNVRLFLFLGLVLILGQGLMARRLAPRIGEVRLTQIGLLLGLAAPVLLAEAHGSLGIYSGLGLLALGTSLFNPALSALASLYGAERAQGRSLGGFRAAASLARAGGPLLAALAYFWLGSRAAYLGIAVLMLLPFAVGLWLPSPRGSGAAA